MKKKKPQIGDLVVWLDNYYSGKIHKSPYISDIGIIVRVEHNHLWDPPYRADIHWFSDNTIGFSTPIGESFMLLDNI